MKEPAKEIPQLSKKIEGLKFQHQTLQAVVQADQKERQTQLADVRVETDRLLAERAEKLAEQEAEHRKTLTVIQNEGQELVKAQKATTTSIAEARIELEKVQDKLVAKRMEYAGLEALRNQLEGMKVEQEKLKGDIADLQSSKSKLDSMLIDDKMQKSELERDAAILQEQLIADKSEIETIASNKATLIEEKEAKIAILDQQIYDKQQEFETTDRQMNQVREDLASRKTKLDDREATLRRREMKVEQNEARIQQNSALLSL